MASLTISADRVLPGGDYTSAVDHGQVTIEGAHIAAVGELGDGRGTRAADHFPGCTILPGLINAHAHLAFDPTANAAEAVPVVGERELLGAMHERARQMLRAGATTVRDLGDRDGLAVQVRGRIDRGVELGPRLQVSGPPLTPRGGHCWFLGGAVDGEDDIFAQIHRLADLGVDWIKIMVSGGYITRDGPGLTDLQFSPEQLQAAVKTAGSRGLPVAAHTHSTASVSAALDCGVDTIEHCSMLADDCSTGFRHHLDVETATRLAQSGAAVCSADPHDWERWRRIGGPEAATRQIGRTRWLHDHGVPLIAGTDAGVSPFDELPKALVRHGESLPATEVLHMATGGAAAALGLADRTGSLTPGLEADLIVVRGDPRADLRALLDIQAVVTRGVLVDLEVPAAPSPTTPPQS